MRQSLTHCCIRILTCQDHVPVCQVQPGIIMTDMTAAGWSKDDGVAAYDAAVQRRLHTSEEVGKDLAVLVHGDFPYSTGQVVMVDGGLTLPRFGQVEG